MITVSEYKNKAVGVFGLGKAGQAAVDALTAGGARVYTWDDKSVGTNHFSEWPWAEMHALVLSPGVPLTHPQPHEVVMMARRHDVPVIGDVELLYRAAPEATYVAITGTNGKSTTTTLIAHILKQAGLRVEVGGNLGTPALALAPLGKGGIYVLELSSYQLDLLKTTHFNTAVWLNITPDHLDRHGSMEGYVAAKKHIFDRQQEGDTAVVAVDDAYSRSIKDWASGIREAKVIEISSHERLAQGVYVNDGILHDTSSPLPNAQSLMPIATLTGRHNWQNAAAAYAAARSVGVLPEKIYAAMQTFPGLRHRLQLVATIKDVRFINDSKATNADATSNALAPYSNIYWILGGKAKEGGITNLKEYFPKIAHAFLIGDASGDFAKTLEGKVPYTKCGTLNVAVEKAAAMALVAHPLPNLPPQAGEENNGVVVLLSPACASFDQWKNFEERGDAFCKMVEELAAHAV